MNILHIISGMAPHNGGPSFAMLGLAPAMASDGCHVHVLTTFKSGDDPEMCADLEAAGVAVTRVGPVTGPLQRHAELKSKVDQAVSQADVVHIHGMWLEVLYLAATAAQRQKKPYLIRPCGMLDPWSLSQSRWRKKIMLALRVRKNLENAAALHFTADLERDLTAPLRLRPPAIIEPNGVNLKEVTIPVPESLHLRHAYPQLGQGPVAFFLSRLHHKKGLDLLIQAFADVVKRWPEANAPNAPLPGLAIAGSGEPEYVESLIAMAANLEIADRVVFTGQLLGEAKAAAFQSADVFCLPSHQENFGIAVAEALAAGTFVVISDQINIYREIVDAGLGDAVSLESNELADALLNRLKNPPQKAAARAGVWATDRYNWDRIAERWVQVHYPTLLNQIPGSLTSHS